MNKQKHYSREDLENYLIDSKGYSIEDIDEVINDGGNLEYFMNDEDWDEFEEYTK